MAGTDLQNISDFVFGTHQRWLAKDAWPWIIELLKKDFFACELIFGDKKKIQFTTGKFVEITVHLGGDSTFEWTLPYEDLTRSGTKGLTSGTVPLRYANSSSLLSEYEIDQNEGGKEQIVPLAKLKREEMMSGMAEGVETAYFAQDGNYASAKKMLGLRYFITPDGLHITGSGAVQGIDPAVETRFQNQFITPDGSSDGMGAISDFSGLRDAMVRMCRAVRWSRPKVGNLAHVLDDGKPTDSMRSNGDNYCILQDDRTWFKWEQLQFTRRDDMSKDMHAGIPMFYTYTLQPNENLGIPTAGRPAGLSKAGQWGDGGETYFINKEEIKPIVHRKHAPKIHKPKVHQDQHTMIHDSSLWCNTGVRSRRRLGVIMGYAVAA